MTNGTPHFARSSPDLDAGRWFTELALVPRGETVMVAGLAPGVPPRQAIVVDARAHWYDDGEAGYLIGFPGEGHPDPLAPRYRRLNLWRRYAFEVRHRDPQTGQDRGFARTGYVWALDLASVAGRADIRASWEVIADGTTRLASGASTPATA